MLISEIKDKELRELAELRTSEYYRYKKPFLLSVAFDWRQTDEGYDFWSKVNNGNITELTKNKENVNNASHNAIDEIKTSYALQDIAKESRSPLSEVKEIYREVKDLGKVKNIVALSDELRVDVFKVLRIIKTLENE